MEDTPTSEVLPRVGLERDPRGGMRARSTWPLRSGFAMHEPGGGGVLFGVPGRGRTARKRRDLHGRRTTGAC